MFRHPATPIGYVVWFTRNRSYLSRRTEAQIGAELLDQAKVFASAYEAEQEAKKFSYPTKDGQVKEPYEINPVGLRLWEDA